MDLLEGSTTKFALQFDSGQDFVPANACLGPFILTRLMHESSIKAVVKKHAYQTILTQVIFQMDNKSTRWSYGI